VLSVVVNHCKTTTVLSFIPEDDDIMFLHITGIYVQVHMASQHRRTSLLAPHENLRCYTARQPLLNIAFPYTLFLHLQ
jgi:hypothetical protein